MAVFKVYHQFLTSVAESKTSAAPAAGSNPAAPAVGSDPLGEGDRITYTNTYTPPSEIVLPLYVLCILLLCTTLDF